MYRVVAHFRNGRFAHREYHESFLETCRAARAISEGGIRGKLVDVGVLRDSGIIPGLGQIDWQPVPAAEWLEVQP